MAKSPRTYLVFLLIVLFPINVRSFKASVYVSRSTGHHTSSVGNTWRSNPNQAHSYPASKGLSGSGSQHQQVHSYSASTGLFGDSGYTNSSRVHNHYYYTAPQNVTHGSVNYPVYHGEPPVYVYEYKNSGSRFDTLLSGLGLYNLGKMSARHNSYMDTPQSGEICLFEIGRNDGSFEKTRIDCRLISSFIWEAERVEDADSQQANNSVDTVLSTNTTTENDTTVMDALQVKGPSIELTPEMSCFIVRMLGGYTQLRQRVECHLLERYSNTSFLTENVLLKTILLCFIMCLIIFLACFGRKIENFVFKDWY